jgi:phospholipase D1/2
MQASPAQVSVIRRSRTRLIGMIAIGVLLVGLAIAWSVTPLAQVLDPRKLAGIEQQLRNWPFAPFAVIAIFVASGLIATPATLMIGATVLLFGTWPGILYAFAGMLANGTVVYAIGRFGARDMVDEWLARRSGSRLDAFNRRLGQRGFIAVALIRLTPIPYSLQNVLAGASRIGYPDFLLGTAIGILPVIALMTGLATEFDAWASHPDWGRLLALFAAAIAVIAIGWSIRRWAARHRAGR